MFSPAQRAGDAPSGGIPSSGLHGPGSSRTGHLQRWKAGGEHPQSLQRRAGVLRPLSNKGARISYTSVSPGASGVLRTPASSTYACLHSAHCVLHSSLRAVPGHRALFCAVEETVLPRTPFSRGVNISSGRSRNMAHRRDRISIRDPKEGVRRLALGMVLCGRCSTAGYSLYRPPGVQQGSSEETPKLAPAEPSTGGRQERPLFDGPD